MWLIHRRRRYTVSGSSMAPLLKPGQELLADPHSRTSVGDIVVSLHPHRNDVVFTSEEGEHSDEDDDSVSSRYRILLRCDIGITITKCD